MFSVADIAGTLIEPRSGSHGACQLWTTEGDQGEMYRQVNGREMVSLAKSSDILGSRHRCCVAFVLYTLVKFSMCRDFVLYCSPYCSLLVASSNRGSNSFPWSPHVDSYHKYGDMHDTSSDALYSVPSTVLLTPYIYTHSSPLRRRTLASAEHPGDWSWPEQVTCRRIAPFRKKWKH